MDYFSSITKGLSEALSPFKAEAFTYKKSLWCDEGHSRVILQRDTAFELNGTGFNVISDESLENEVAVYGEDLDRIKNKCSFARITLLNLSDDYDGQALYDLIKKTDYVKYHFFPEGYMVRSSSEAHKEAVRVSKDAIKKGISFEKIGSAMIEKYLQIEGVKGAKVIFVTDKNADYKKIESLARKNGEIVKTLNHVINNMEFDCKSCNLKPICDEVEGMRELHFKSKGNENG